MRFALVVLLTACGLVAQQDAELRAARVPVEKYLEGHATGRREPILEAFHPGARVQGLTANGEMRDWSLEEYARGFTGKAPEGAEKRLRRIEMIEIDGTAGVARATVELGPVMATDYFLLLKRDGQWRISNKVFSVKPK